MKWNDLRALCRRNLVFSIDRDHVHLHGTSMPLLLTSKKLPLLLTSKKLCAGGFQITLFGRSGKEGFLSLELASNSCLESSGSQLPEQRSPVRLVLLEHAKTNQSMSDREACRRFPSVLISRTGFIFRYAHDLDFLLSLSAPPSLPLILSFSSLPSTISSLPPSLSLSLCLSLCLSLSPSILPLSSLSSYYYYISQLVYLLTINMNSLDFSLLFFRISSNFNMHGENNNKKQEGTKKVKKTPGLPQSLRKRITHI